MENELQTIDYGDGIAKDRLGSRAIILFLAFSLPAMLGLIASWHCFDNNPPLWFQNVVGPYICFHGHTIVLMFSFGAAIMTAYLIELNRTALIAVGSLLAIEYVVAGGLGYLLMFASAMSF